MGAIASITAVAVHSSHAVLTAAAILFALGSFAVFIAAGGRRHAKPPVAVPTDQPTSVSGNTTPAVVQPDTERDGGV
jgi:hypothetical protein